MLLDSKIAAAVLADAGLWRDFNDICDCGGRLAGTESERRAFALLRERVRAASPANAGRSIPVPYGVWRAKRASLRLSDGSHSPCHPLVRTVATAPQGLTAEVIDRVAGLAAGPARPLDNTDFSHPYRKRVTRVFVARALSRLAGGPQTLGPDEGAA